MAHEITTINGKTQFIESDLFPRAWHGLGATVEGRLLNRNDILTGIYAESEQVPLIAVINGVQVAVPGKALTFRTDKDTNEVFPVDVVGEKFQSIGVHRLLDWVDEHIGTGSNGENYANAALLRDGKTLLLAVPVPSASFDIVGSDDRHDWFLNFSQQASSYRPDMATLSGIRALCANTERASENAAVSKIMAKHNAEDQSGWLTEAMELLGIVNKQAEEMKEFLTGLTKVEPTEDQIESVLSQLFVSEDGETTRAESRRANRKAKILELAECGAGNDRAGIRGTAYGFYNGVTEYVTHYRGREADIKAAARLNVAVPGSLKQAESVNTGSGSLILSAMPEVFTRSFLN